MAFVSNASLVDALRQYRLLESVQLEEAARLQSAHPEPKALAGELIQRKWLTPYQANQLLQGRGQDLLLGSYVLLEKLGEGGMGAVFKARNWKLGRVVAVKLIRKERLENADAVRRFEREVRAAAALSHPNILLAIDADQIGGTHLLVMECIEGATDLAKLVKKQGPLPVAQACEYVRQAAMGLQHAFERGLVHRDVKPGNLLVTADARVVKILDMGLARLDHSGTEDDKNSTMTPEGTIMGTPDYIAPEQALESHTVDIRADLYSLGCTFYFLLTGRVPFPGGSLTEKLIKHQLHNPEPVEQVRPDLPLWVAGVVRKLMAKKPEDRYQTPAEAATALAFSPDEGEEPTVVATGRGAEAAVETSADTLAYRYAPPAGEHAQGEETKYGKVLYRVTAGCFVLVSLAVLSFLFFKGSTRIIPSGLVANPLGVPDSTSRAASEAAWLREVAGLPAEKQVEAVAAKLKERNPGFKEMVTHKIEGGVVTELKFVTDNVTNISPVRALTGLRTLLCSGTSLSDHDLGKGRLADLSPLKGMKLTTLECKGTQVIDLSPLKDMKLTMLQCSGTPVSDLSPLRDMKLLILFCSNTAVSDLSPLKDMKLEYLGCVDTKVTDLSPLKDMKLTELYCSYTKVSDLSPLRGMALRYLQCSATQVTDLSPLKDMNLRELGCRETPVSDLAPLKGMNLTYLDCSRTKVTDLSPLRGMPLKDLRCDFKPERDAEILRSIKTLEKINGKPAKQFWQEVDARKSEKKP